MPPCHRVTCSCLLGAARPPCSFNRFFTRLTYLRGVKVRKVTVEGKGKRKREGSEILTEQTVVEKRLEELYSHGIQYEKMPLADQPPDVTTTLFPHQRKALWWMRQQERVRNANEVLAEQAAETRAAGDVGLYRLVHQGGQHWSNVFTNSLTPKHRPPSLPRGGILADDMGLGKTLEILSLIGSNSALGLTLVVCPLSVASNWSDQAATHCPQLKVSVFHGPARSSAGWTDAHCATTSTSI